MPGEFDADVRVMGVARVLLAPLRPAADLLDLTGDAVAALGIIATELLLRTLTIRGNGHQPGETGPSRAGATDPPRPPLLVVEATRR